MSINLIQTLKNKHTRFNWIFGKIQNLMRFNGLNKIKETIMNCKYHIHGHREWYN